jgi:hypothetical protein
MSIGFRASYNAAVKLYSGIKQLAKAGDDPTKIASATTSIQDANRALTGKKAGWLGKTIAWIACGRKGLSTGMTLAKNNPALGKAMTVAATHFGNDDQTVKALTQMAVSLGGENSTEFTVADLKFAAKGLTATQITNVLVDSRIGDNANVDRSQRYKNVVKPLLEEIKINKRHETKLLHTALVGTVKKTTKPDGTYTGKLVGGDNLQGKEKIEVYELFKTACKGNIHESDLKYFATSFSHYLNKNTDEISQDLKNFISITPKKVTEQPHQPDASKWIGLSKVMNLSRKDCQAFIIDMFAKHPNRNEQSAILSVLAYEGALSHTELDALEGLQQRNNTAINLQPEDYATVRKLIPDSIGATAKVQPLQSAEERLTENDFDLSKLEAGDQDHVIQCLQKLEGAHTPILITSVLEKFSPEKRSELLKEMWRENLITLDSLVFYTNSLDNLKKEPEGEIDKAIFQLKNFKPRDLQQRTLLRNNFLDEAKKENQIPLLKALYQNDLISTGSTILWADHFNMSNADIAALVSKTTAEIERNLPGLKAAHGEQLGLDRPAQQSAVPTKSAVTQTGGTKNTKRVRFSTDTRPEEIEASPLASNDLGTTPAVSEKDVNLADKMLAAQSEASGRSNVQGDFMALAAKNAYLDLANDRINSINESSGIDKARKIIYFHSRGVMSNPRLNAFLEASRNGGEREAIKKYMDEKKIQ